jgi:short-subunit dehydrogenase
MQLQHKTFLITGASGGIGSALARSLVAAGASVVVHGRDEKRLGAVLATLPDGTPSVLADLSTDQGRAALVAFARAHRNIDGVVLNAASGHFGPFLDMSAAAIEQLIVTDLIAPLVLARALIPQLAQRDSSALVFVGSTLGRIGHPGFSVYGAAKGGLHTFAEALARELGGKGPRILHVAPRATRTAMNDGAARAMNSALKVAEDSPERVADAIVGALRRDARRLQLGTPEKLFVRINSVVPALVDRALAGKRDTIMKFASDN